MFIVKVPGINGLTNTKGCENAGNEILKILKNEIFLNEAGNKIEFEKLNLEEIHLNNLDLELSNKLIYENSLETFELKPKTIFLGGDHSISYSTIKSFFEYCQILKREPCLIVFDAHPDCMQIVKGSKKYPHNRAWLRYLIESGFPAKNILLVGVRNISLDEVSFLRDHKIKTISMNQLLENIEETCEIIMEFSDKKDLYLSLDIDVLDSIFVPGTEFPETGGLSSREFIYLIQRLNKIKSLRAIDLVEINSMKDKEKLTLKIGAKIISELI